MSVVVVAVIRPKPDHTQRILDAFAEVSPLVHDEAGCELYAAHTDGSAVVMVERWTSRDDLAAHSAGEPLKRLRSVLQESVDSAPEMWALDEVPLGDPAKGTIQITPDSRQRR
jgi:quinol monooxygenase YgiN